MLFKSNGRVRSNTSENINRRIDQEVEARVRYLSMRGKSEIDDRIDELNKEWDIERTLEVNAGSLALAGVLLSAFVDKKWLILPGIVTAFLVQHSIQGWCPPLPLFRMLGIRTKEEIEKEKMALKAVRGDFKNVSQKDDDLKRAEKALEAVFNGA